MAGAINDEPSQLAGRPANQHRNHRLIIIANNWLTF
jgi:hypothetical protein